LQISGEPVTHTFFYFVFEFLIKGRSHKFYFIFPNIFAKVNLFLLKNKIHTETNKNKIKIPQVSSPKKKQKINKSTKH
jgi:hypothetical protein